MNTKQTQLDISGDPKKVDGKSIYSSKENVAPSLSKEYRAITNKVLTLFLLFSLFFVSSFSAFSQSCTSPILNFTSPNLISGTAGEVGAVYRFNTVMTGTNALVTIKAKSHSDIEVAMMDAEASTYGGYNSAFQPIVDYNWINGDGTFDSPGEKSITFKVEFVSSSTGVPIVFNELNITGVDIDGSEEEVREFMETSDFQSYELQDPTTLTLSGGLKAKGALPAQPGIDETALHAMISYKFLNRSSFEMTVGGDWNGSTINFGDTDIFNTDEKRYHSIYMKCYNFDVTVDCPSVNATGGGSYCSGITRTLTATTGGGSGTCDLQWQFSNDNVNWTDIAGATGNTYTTPVLTTTGYYRAAYTCSGNTDCGTNYSTVQVLTVNQSPTVNAGADASVCRFFNTTLSASASGGSAPYSYSWSNAPGTGNDQIVAPMNTTTYTVTVTSNNGCNDTDQITVTVNDCYEICGNGLDDDGDGDIDCADSECGPSVDLGTDLNNCTATDLTLTATASGGNGALTIAWSDGLGTGTSKTVAPATTTTYSVTVTAPSGCTATDQMTVTIVPCSENCYNGLDDDGDNLVDCQDPDCLAVASPQLQPDVYTTCPGIPYSNRVTYNDANLHNPVFSIVAQPAFGTVSIDQTGKFIYTPSGLECTTDNFIYQVCNQLSGCCATATVDITLGDNTYPVLTNVPADLTISCDDVVPDVTTVTGFDECPGLYITYEESSNQHFLGACESYTITRTWTAEDFCGNQVSQSQNISVMDLTKPEIFQVYTLQNGKRLIAGVSQRVTDHWKYVPFPITFDGAPVILSQVSTNNDQAAVISRQRNETPQGFELRVAEEEAADGKHNNESVAWFAIEPGALDGNMDYVAGTFANVSDAMNTLVFGQAFTGAPLLFTSLMTDKEMEAATVSVRSINGNQAELLLEEETSQDAETVHAYENIGFLALQDGNAFVDAKNERFGEAGKLNVSNAWMTVNLGSNYTKPVVICGSLSKNDSDPTTIRVRNVTSNSFEVRLQEWDYLDGNHAAEAVSWMVVEGSIPGNQGYYCSGNSVNNLQPNVNVFAIDNCDDIAAFGYQENEANAGNGLLTTRTWMAIDDCGNTAIISRYDTCVVAAVKVKTMLYGASMNAAGDLMRDNLRSLDLVPVEEPYSQINSFSHVEYYHDDAPVSNETMITICMDDDGTPTTMEVPQSELHLYLNSGALVGDCADNPNGMVTICHKPGTPAEQTKVIPQPALMGHLGHGDVIGSCSGVNADLPAGVSSPNYQTISDGNWSDPAVWQGGNVPSFTNINNKTILITNNVTVQSSNVQLKNNSELYVIGGSITMMNGDFKIEKSKAVFTNSSFDGSSAGNFEISKSEGEFIAEDCTISIGQNFTNKGTRVLEHVNLSVGESMYNIGGQDTLRKVCAVIDDNVSNSWWGKMHLEDVQMKLTYGSFWNLLVDKVTGDNFTILTETGSLSNVGSWELPIAQYCVADSLLIPAGYLPPDNECVDIVNFFNPCNCDHDEEETNTNNNGGNNGGTTTVVDEETVNAGNSQGDGEMDPALLEVTGDAAIVDWVLLELRNENDDTEILGYATVGLQRDGNIITEDGDDVIVFPGLGEGNYYVALRHRNHLGVMTDEPVYLSTNDVPFLDFTDAALEVRGGFSAGKIYNGKRQMWAGDFNEDGKVIYQGPFNDVFYLFSRILSEPENETYLANFIVQGYEVPDVNLDGKVIYQGPGNDRAPLLYHTILSHPGNGAFLANYIVSGKLP